MLHGEIEAKKSEETAKQTFTDNSLGDNLPSVSINQNQLKNKSHL